MNWATIKQLLKQLIQRNVFHHSSRNNQQPADDATQSIGKLRIDHTVYPPSRNTNPQTYATDIHLKNTNANTNEASDSKS